MDERAGISLQAVIKHDIAAVEKLHATLVSLAPDLKEGVDYRTLAAIAYCLHNL